MDLLNKAFIRKYDFIEDVKKGNSKVIIYLYRYDKGEYKAEYYLDGVAALSEWVTEEEILKYFIPLENILSDFNMKCFENHITEKQFYYIYRKYKEYTLNNIREIVQ